MTLGQNNPFGGQPVVHRSRIVEIRVWEPKTRVVIQHPADGDESHVDDRHDRATLLDAQPKPVGGLRVERHIRPPALPPGMSPQCSLTVSARALSDEQLMTPAVDHYRWREGLDALMDQISARFTRYDAARNAGAFILGALSATESKNCWTSAELSGHGTPDRRQHLLSRAKRDADDIRDDLRGYVVEAFGDPDAALVVDETGDIKKGTKTVGVQR